MIHRAGEPEPSRQPKRAYVYRARFIGGDKEFPLIAFQIYPNNHFISSSHNRIVSSIRKRSTKNGSCHTFLTFSRRGCFALLALGLIAGGCATMDPRELKACGSYVIENFRPIATERTGRFLGKVEDDTARCRGGGNAVKGPAIPWVDWPNYWATRDDKSKAYGAAVTDRSEYLAPNGRGIVGALLDLEYQRMEMIKFNLFDNTETYEKYVDGRVEEGKRQDGPTLKEWNTMRLPEDYQEYTWQGEVEGWDWTDVYKTVGGSGKQTCWGNLKLIRFRTLTGSCNDINNPRMGSTNQPFARNVEFETTFPDLKTKTEYKIQAIFPDSQKRKAVEDRHDNRLGLLNPDPLEISRKLFTRKQEEPNNCDGIKLREGTYKRGDPNELPEYSALANCNYVKAPWFNVLASFWIQFMTHDWFSHLEDGHNRMDRDKPNLMPLGCAKEDVTGVRTRPSPEELKEFGCKPDPTRGQIDRAIMDKEDKPPAFDCKEGKQGEERETKCLNRAYKTTSNTVTAWWDASQIYGYDKASRKRVKRDGAKLLMEQAQDKLLGYYLPVFKECQTNKGGCDPGEEKYDSINEAWSGQEATAFPDNWSIGMSFFHNVFAREHNFFVETFRNQKPDADSGLRDPANPKRGTITYSDVTDDELFEIARLVVSAEIAKIHTTEWTTQLLYNEPLYLGMNANWHGLVRKDDPVTAAIMKIVVRNFGKSDDAKNANQWYSVFASGSGIFGLGSYRYAGDTIFAHEDPNKKDIWSLNNPDHVNGGVNHFGSPFNFPEEFVTVYRLHPMVPDLIEYRELAPGPNIIRNKIPVLKTFRGEATRWMQRKGLANWALSMGRQQLGQLTLQNHPQFLQNLPMDRFHTNTGKFDVAALDLIRDRERGVPRFNEFRRQYGLKPLTSFNDFINKNLNEQNPEEKAELERQREVVKTLREVYGWHYCDEKKKPISTAQKDDDPENNDCLGPKERLEDGKVDNVEDLDTVVGWLAEPVRPHGFAISETQFQVFILNASRRLFSDRFFTSSFRPEFYTHFGVDWVTNNGPDGKKMEPHKSNGHEVEVSPLKRVLQRTIPELEPELEYVVNVFDPWARDRGDYYGLQWIPQERAKSDEAFRKAVQE